MLHPDAMKSLTARSPVYRQPRSPVGCAAYLSD